MHGVDGFTRSDIQRTSSSDGGATNESEKLEINSLPMNEFPHIIDLDEYDGLSSTEYSIGTGGSSEQSIDTRPVLVGSNNSDVSVECLVAARIPSVFGLQHSLHLYSSSCDDKQHAALVFGNSLMSQSLNQWRLSDTIDSRRIRGAADYPPQPSLDTVVPLVRIHSCCFTGETLGSLRCDCAEQLHESMRLIAANPEGGAVLYLSQEGRGIGLKDKLMAYNLIDMGHDTLTANVALGFPADARDYRVASAMLSDLGVSRLKLLTNNPHKRDSLTAAGIDVVERIPMVPQAWNDGGASATDRDAYLVTKVQQMGHLLDIPSHILSPSTLGE